MTWPELFTGTLPNCTELMLLTNDALGTVTNNLGKHLNTIGVTTTIKLLQKAALLGTART